jgi:hypothetical protein
VGGVTSSSAERLVLAFACLWRPVAGAGMVVAFHVWKGGRCCLSGAFSWIIPSVVPWLRQAGWSAKRVKA